MAFGASRLLLMVFVSAHEPLDRYFAVHAGRVRWNPL